MFENHNYLSLKTYRKNGSGVPTAVWFALENGHFYITTRPESGKVKRITRNPNVEVAPCDVQGNLLDAYVPATVRIMSPSESAIAFSALEKKYRSNPMWANLIEGRANSQRVFMDVQLKD